MMVITTQRLGRFFPEIGEPVRPHPPSLERIRRSLATAARYEHWNASPEEKDTIAASATAARGNRALREMK
jgi:hypothetical protein